MSLLDSVLNVGLAAVGRSSAASTTAESGLLPVLVELLSANGGLDALVGKFDQAGLGTIIQSWISNQTDNQPISSEQLQKALGSDLVKSLADKVGLDAAQLQPQLSQFLPVAVDRLTPNGNIAQTGVKNVSELMGLFGNILRT